MTRELRDHARQVFDKGRGACCGPGRLCVDCRQDEALEGCGRILLLDDMWPICGVCDEPVDPQDIEGTHWWGPDLANVHADCCPQCKPVTV